ncbi:hypothetical protein SPF06_02435 [Sinomonas sp. JGH33]|uniref:Calpain catalytic domain-containing protein n=1 Tax=Sinomonas terricola TaxID=3110330 RepID=A0ABU5T1P9_9MICC|nr:hypothetical protein [Sinomonas sp. JGH33]MEA5453570.1 hypothetical protein [Sinomonas sp. JGH33]
MGHKVGADVEALRSAGRSMIARAGGLEQCSRELDRIAQLETVWAGQDTDSFQAAWFRGTRPQLTAVVAAVRSAGETMLRNADAQEAVSNDLGAELAPIPTPRPDPNADHSVPRYPNQGQADLTDAQLRDLKDKLRDATDITTGDDFVGNGGDIASLRDALAKLSPAELNQFLASLSDDELRRLGQTVGGDNSGLFGGGTNAFDRQDLLDQLLSKASPDQARRVESLIPWYQPDAQAMGDQAHGQTGDHSNAWMTPNGPVISDHPQGPADIRQGGYGTCVVDSSAGALVNADPNWAKDHVVENANGTVSVKLYEDGHEHWVTVSKDLPDDGSGGQKGAKPGPGGNWNAYVEKALAQVYADDDSNDGPGDKTYGPGNYRAIEGNYGPDVLKYLTPQGTTQDHDPGTLWQAAHDGRPAIVSTFGTKPDGAPDGYVAGHEFFVVGTDGDKVILQNPWGPTETKLVITQDQYSKYFQNATVVNR